MLGTARRRVRNVGQRRRGVRVGTVEGVKGRRRYRRVYRRMTGMGWVRRWKQEEEEK